MNWLLTALLLVNLAIFFLFVSLVLAARRIINEFRSFVEPAGENPSPLAKMWALAARVLVVELKTTLMGIKSGQVRGEQAVMEAMTEDSINAQAPLIGAGLDAFPALKRKLTKNPALAEVAMSLFSRFSRPPGGPAADNGDKPGDYAARLGRFGG